MAKEVKNQISFTKEVKNEITLVEDRNVSSSLALLSSFIKINSSLAIRGKEWVLKIQSENQKVAKLILSLIRNIFKLECRAIVTEKKHFKKPGNNTVIIIEVLNGVENMLKTLQIYNDKNKFDALPTYEFLKDIEIKKSYLAGAFLASGSVNSPETSNYHLEIAVNSDKHANLIINQLASFYLEAKKLDRRNSVIVYIKKSESIADFLRVVGAYQCLYKFENVRIQRDQYNSVNRMNNCDMANLNKAVKNGMAQQAKIKIIADRKGLDNLPEKYRDLARIRLEHPEYSLNDLIDAIYDETGVSLSKSGINHRLQRLMDMADELVGDNNG